MVKGISAITNLGKKAAMATMFAGAITLGANAATKHTQTNTTTPTELVSKDAASALKANAITQTPEVPKTHNPKLDKTFKKFIETDEERVEYNNFLNQMYSYKGTFYGSLVVQHEIDRQMLSAFLNKKNGYDNKK